MELATSVVEAAHRLGLSLAIDASTSSTAVVTRSGWTVRVEASDLFDNSRDRTDHLRAAWLLAGLRFGIDKLAGADDNDDQTLDSPTAFRRTSLRRYHEAPSIHGDRLQLLVPQITRQTFEAVADTTAFYRSWIIADLQLLVLRETGKRLDILTSDEQSRSDQSDETRWQKSRSALFYQSYKVRPTTTKDVPGGRLRVIETGEGFGASRALLLPEFDYDASRDYGYLAIPTRDRIIVARPQERDMAPEMLPALRDAIDESITDSNFALTDAIVQLKPDSVEPLRQPSLDLSTAPPPAQRILSISAP